MVRSADYSDDGQYLYGQWYIWHFTRPLLPVIGLFPRRREEGRLSDTLTLRMRETDAWAAYGGVVLLHLYALRGDDFSELRGHSDPVGPRNDSALLAAVEENSLVLCAWGLDGHEYRTRPVIERLALICRLGCLGTMPNGAPRDYRHAFHPQEIQPWEPTRGQPSK